MEKLGRDELIAALKPLVYLCARSGGVEKTLLKIEEVMQMNKASAAAAAEEVRSEEVRSLEGRSASCSRDASAPPLQHGTTRDVFSINKRITWADASDDDEE